VPVNESVKMGWPTDFPPPSRVLQPSVANSHEATTRGISFVPPPPQAAAALRPTGTNGTERAAVSDAAAGATHWQAAITVRSSCWQIVRLESEFEPNNFSTV
jgi:hypothetical protein